MNLSRLVACTRSVRRAIAPTLLLLATILSLVAVPSCSQASTRYEAAKDASVSKIPMTNGFVNRAGSATVVAVDGPFDEVWVIVRRSDGHDAARSSSEMPGTGSLVSTVRDDRGLPVSAFPLESTDVHADLRGPIASVRVAQRFSNPYRDTIEAAYVFPLPHDAAVSDFVMRIGERRIRGIVREREEADRIYADARAQGYVASLLAEERPNIFMERVANIEPGHAIEVELTYFNMLAYADGWYEWRFPLVVGPRFNPPGGDASLAAVPAGDGARRGEVSGIEYLAPGQRTRHTVGIEAVIDAGLRVGSIECASHADARIERDGDREGARARVHLTGDDRAANRDFVLRYQVGGREPTHGLVSTVAPDGEGYFALTVYPPVEVRSSPRMPIDIVYVVDRSGSMQGRPLDQAKAAIRASLDRLQPGDRFQIVEFGSDAGGFGDTMRPYDETARREAIRYVDGIDARGGTMVLAGLRRALELPKTEGRVQYLAFLSDGFVTNEAEILGRLHAELGDRRVFAFGVGSSANWSLLHAMAGVGRGAVADIALDADAAEPMGRFMDSVVHPAMHATRIDWSGVSVQDVWPRQLPDLIAGRPITVLGRYDPRDGGATARATLRGWVGGESVSIPMSLRFASGNEEGCLDRLWARAKIAQLADDAIRAGSGAAEANDAILRTALRYGISSPLTAFVAVDGSRVTQGTQRTTVVQPVPVPAGVRYETTVAPQTRSE